MQGVNDIFLKDFFMKQPDFAKWYFYQLIKKYEGEQLYLNELGYVYGNEEKTNEVLKDGWFYTGDLGYMDKDGFIFITGRQKNVIVLKNGKNIYPEEIEALIVKQPYVSEVMAFGKEKDDDLLLSVKIVYNEDYVKQNYPDMSEEDFRKVVWNDIKEINKTLPQYKYIKNLILTNEPMVKTTTSKIKRFEEIKKENVK